jgi:hypothetical protein
VAHLQLPRELFAKRRSSTRRRFICPIALVACGYSLIPAPQDWRLLMSEEVTKSKASKEPDSCDSAKLLKQLHDEILKQIKGFDEMIMKMSMN